MSRAIAYLRMSREKLDQEWRKRQLEDSRAIAERKGATLADEDILIDTVSASKFSTKERTGYRELLRRIEAGGIDYVICWMEDRAHRQVLELAEFINLCRKYNVTPITPAAEYDLDDPDQISMWFIKVRFAEAEVEKMSKRLRRQRLQAAANGKRHGGGSRAFGTTGSGKRKVSLHRALAEQDMIREAARRILAGDSLRSIVVDWNTRKPPVASAQGGKWNNSVLRRLLLSPRIAGYRDHKGALHEATEWQPIIPREQWQAVKAILEDPARRTTVGGGQPKYLLTGLARCGVCNQPLRCRRGVYYCPQITEAGGHVSRKAEPVEEMILRALFKAVEEGQEWGRQATVRPNGDPTRPHYERLAELAAELDVLDRRIGEAELAEELGRRPHPSAATLRRMLADREAEQERHQAAVSRLQHGRVAARVPRNLRQVWSDLSLDRQRSILAAMIEWVKIDPQGGGRFFDPDAIKVKPRWQGVR
jgi:DNA invertase Pin-like site-specific DNA recombinase